MINLKKGAILPAVAVMTLVGFAGSNLPAFALEPMKKDMKMHKRHMAMHPLTVRRKMAAAPAPVTATGGGPGPGSITAPITGPISTVVGLPFQALGAVFPAPGARSGGPTKQRYAGAGKEADKIDEGFAEPVPVDLSGPIFVVENGDPTINPMSIIGAPISVAGTFAQMPFKIIGATGL